MAPLPGTGYHISDPTFQDSITFIRQALTAAGAAQDSFQNVPPPASSACTYCSA